MSAQGTPKTKAADLLLRAQVLNRPQYERALAFMQSTQERAEDVLIDHEILSEAELLKALSGIYRTHFVSADKLSKADIPRATVQMIPRRVAETLGVFPVLFDRQTSVLSVVTPDPDNLDMLREVKLVSGARDVKAFVARPAAVSAAIRKHHAGDVRAFERFERQISYEFGQQVLADGRVMAAKDTYSRSVGEDDGAIDRSTPLPVQKARRSSPEFEPEEFAGRRAHASAPFIEPPPPPLPRKQTVRRPTLDRPMSPSPVATALEHAHSPSRRQTSTFEPLSPQHELSSFVAPSGGSSLPPLSDNDVQAFLSDTTLELFTVMVSLLENARQELRGHSSQVARLLRRVAERMSLEKSDTYAVVVAGLIHDIGKMGQFHLTALNCGEYEGHRIAAQKAYDTPLRLLEAVRLPSTVKDAVFHMYERFDGNGFPDKLVGKEIPLGARLLAVADTYADLTQNPRNPFRKVLGPTEAMDVLYKHRGKIFDPAILDLFKALVLGEDMKAKLLANRHRALIVDADPEESTLLELRMVEQGFDVKIVRSAEAARRAVAVDNADFDLVVCEVELPDADGLAFLSEARTEKWGHDVAWVVCTRKQGRAEAQRAFDLGAMDFVAKPVRADVLVAKIKAMLDQRSQSGKGGVAKGVRGSLSEMGLPDIVQVLVHGRKTGKLNIKSGGNSGEIHFLDGAVANAVVGNLSGADAFYAMVRFQDGEFALDPSFVPSKRLVAESAEALLLEGMRRMDEGL